MILLILPVSGKFFVAVVYLGYVYSIDFSLSNFINHSVIFV